MNDSELRAALRDLADVVQVAALLSTDLRRELGASAEVAVELDSTCSGIESAVRRAITILGRFNSKGGQR
jgi:hypothetical protein